MLVFLQVRELRFKEGVGVVLGFLVEKVVNLGFEVDFCFDF